MFGPFTCTYQGFMMVWYGPSCAHSGRRKYSAYRTHLSVECELAREQLAFCVEFSLF